MIPRRFGNNEYNPCRASPDLTPDLDGGVVWSSPLGSEMNFCDRFVSAKSHCSRIDDGLMGRLIHTDELNRLFSFAPVCTSLPLAEPSVRHVVCSLPTDISPSLSTSISMLRCNTTTFSRFSSICSRLQLREWSPNHAVLENAFLTEL